jgi:hypothetical protein
MKIHFKRANLVISPVQGCFFLLAALFIQPVSTASAQVVYTFGADEYYDDNVFLEDDKGVPAPVIVDSQLEQPGANTRVPDQFNGDPDDSYITNVFLGASGTVPLSKYLRTAASGRVGGIFMHEYSNQDRVTLDSNVTITPEQGFLPEPFTFSISDSIQSRGNNVGTANGTASQQAQTHQVGLTLGATEMRLADKTTASIAYGFNYSQFLGAFLLNKQSEEDLGAYANQGTQDRDDGSDFITNGIDASINRSLSQSWVAGIFAGTTYFTYTRLGSQAMGDNGNLDKSDLDRIDGRGGLRSSYQASDKFIINGSVGALLTNLVNDPEPFTQTVIDSDGNVSEVLVSPDNQNVSLIYSGGFTFIPVPSFTTIFTVDQTAGPDINGNRITTRSANLDAIKTVGDRLRLGAGGRFIQFNGGDSLSGATDRWEASAFIVYNLFQNLAIHGGWNFGIQNSDNSSVQETLYGTGGDYEFNRFFIGLSTGFTASKS